MGNNTTYTRQDAMEYLKVSSKNTITNYVKKGVLPNRRFGREFRFYLSDLKKALKLQSAPTSFSATKIIS